jgi:hypothetical protein
MKSLVWLFLAHCGNIGLASGRQLSVNAPRRRGLQLQGSGSITINGPASPSDQQTKSKGAIGQATASELEVAKAPKGTKAPKGSKGGSTIQATSSVRIPSPVSKARTQDPKASLQGQSSSSSRSKGGKGGGSLSLLSPTSARPDTQRCTAVAEETLTTGLASQTYSLELGFIVGANASVETILEDVRDALQAKVAPLLTNCDAYKSTLSPTGAPSHISSHKYAPTGAPTFSHQPSSAPTVYQSVATRNHTEVENVVFGAFGSAVVSKYYHTL